MRGSKVPTDLSPAPWWVLNPRVEMFEGEDEDEEVEEEDDDSEGENDDDSEDEDEEDEDDAEAGKKNIAGLKSALQKERDARKADRLELKRLKAIEKEVNRKKKGDESELETVKTEKDEAVGKVSKLTELLKKNAVDTAIMAAAQKEKFRDVDDALSLVDRSAIELEFDEDDEEVSIEVDATSVVEAVKKLAKSKPHLILADGDEEESGGKVGSKKKKKSDQQMTEQALKDQYPALRS